MRSDNQDRVTEGQMHDEYERRIPQDKNLVDLLFNSLLSFSFFPFALLYLDLVVRVSSGKLDIRGVVYSIIFSFCAGCIMSLVTMPFGRASAVRARTVITSLAALFAAAQILMRELSGKYFGLSDLLNGQAANEVSSNIPKGIACALLCAMPIVINILFGHSLVIASRNGRRITAAICFTLALVLLLLGAAYIASDRSEPSDLYICSEGYTADTAISRFGLWGMLPLDVGNSIVNGIPEPDVPENDDSTDKGVLTDESTDSETPKEETTSEITEPSPETDNDISSEETSFEETTYEQSTEAEETTAELTTAPETTEQETAPVPTLPSVSFSFIGMGDNLIHSPIFRESKKDDGSYDFKPKYAGVADMIKNADIAFINQETPMCGAAYGYHNYPNFNTPQQMGYDLIELGFDVISFANNHVADQGRASIPKMLDLTEKLDALTVGLYRSAADSANIRILEKGGIKIAFLAYTYGTNVFEKNTGESYGTFYIPVYTEEKLKADMKIANELADFIIVSMHWGEEGSYDPNDEQRAYARLLCALGADVILGHHPHVVQPIEELTRQDGHRTLCYYSLGNGINCQDYLRNMVGITASFDIVSDGFDVTYKNPSCIPTFSYQSYPYKNVCLMLLSDLTDELAKKHHCNTSEGRRVTFARATLYITDAIDKKYRPTYLQ